MTLRSLVAFPLITMVASCSGGASAPLPEVTDPLAYLGRVTLAGPSLDVERLRGKVVVVNFWSPG